MKREHWLFFSIPVGLCLATATVAGAKEAAEDARLKSLHCRASMPAFFSTPDFYVTPAIVSTENLPKGKARHEIKSTSMRTENDGRVLKIVAFKNRDEGREVREELELDVREPAHSEWKRYAAYDNGLMATWPLDCSLSMPKEENGSNGNGSPSGKTNVVGPGAIPPPPELDGGNDGIDH